MLHSTYRRPPPPEQPALPAPWTQHKAPSGHIYYYNPETKQSTYTHPGIASTQAAQTISPQPISQPLRYAPHAFSDFAAQATGQFHHGNTSSRGNFHHGRHNRFRQPQDRPKSKLSIPGCSPWVLVKTRLGRRFVHNPTTNESYWKIPNHLNEGIKELDDIKFTELPASEKVEDDAQAHDDQKGSNEGSDNNANLDDRGAEESDEYEEVEVTDEELEDEKDEDDNETSPAKRPRLSDDAQEPNIPAEFGEDEMAYQLAQMEGEYDKDDDYYDDGWQEGNEPEEMTTEEAEASFRDLLDDYKIDPFTTWDAVISDGAIIDDDRYTLLPNMKSRREVFASWSTAKIQARKQEKETQNKRNPLIPYLALLERHATPKLFWAEFKRKYKREPELRDGKLSDKEREKLYRDHINRLTKMSEEARKKDLRTLLESIHPSPSWNRSTTLDHLLPSELLADVRYISLPSATKNSMIIEFLKTLPTQEQLDPGDGQAANAKLDAGHEKLQRALERREREVKDAKRQQEKELHHGKRRLQDENAQLERAMKVDKAALGRALEE